MPRRQAASGCGKLPVRSLPVAMLTCTYAYWRVTAPVTRYLWTPSTEHVTRGSPVEGAAVEPQRQHPRHHLRRAKLRLQPISSGLCGTFCPLQEGHLPHDRRCSTLYGWKNNETESDAAPPRRRSPKDSDERQRRKTATKGSDERQRRKAATKDVADMVRGDSAAHRPSSGTPIEPGTARRSLCAAAGIALLGGMCFSA